MKIKTILATLIFISINSQVYSQNSVEVFVSEFDRHQLRLTMEKNASAFLSEINLAYKENRDLNVEELNVVTSFTLFLQNMWRNTPFYIPDDTIIQNMAQLTNGYYEMRNIPTYFVDPVGGEHYEEAVLQFSPSGMISEIRIGLAAHRYQELINLGQSDIDRANRQTILSFVENFRSSYNRKDLEFIENVFSDQALIIVGRVIQNTGERSAYADQVEFLKFTKEQYIERLRHLFNMNEWIEIGFDNINIIMHPRFNDIYGVELIQHYNSSIYSDVGFLFLLIDFAKPEEPMIHVRTWQPMRQTTESQRFQIGDLEIL